MNEIDIYNINNDHDNIFNNESNYDNDNSNNTNVIIIIMIMIVRKITIIIKK